MWDVYVTVHLQNPVTKNAFQGSPYREGVLTVNPLMKNFIYDEVRASEPHKRNQVIDALRGQLEDAIEADSSCWRHPFTPGIDPMNLRAFLNTDPCLNKKMSWEVVTTEPELDSD